MSSRSSCRIEGSWRWHDAPARWCGRVDWGFGAEDDGWQASEQHIFIHIFYIWYLSSSCFRPLNSMSFFNFPFPSWTLALSQETTAFTDNFMLSSQFSLLSTVCSFTAAVFNLFLSIFITMMRHIFSLNVCRDNISSKSCRESLPLFFSSFAHRLTLSYVSHRHWLY